MTVLADALALGAASRRPGFEYGWVRGTGSAAFILATLASGQAVSAVGLDAIVWAQALLLAVAAFAATRVPELVHQRSAAPAGGAAVLLRLPAFRNLVLAAALVLGSHAMHDAFAVIRWTEAGIGAVTASVLWSEAVAAEVIVFFLIGPALVARLTPAGAIALAAAAGVLRWAVMAQTDGSRRTGAGAAAARRDLRPASSCLHARYRALGARRSRRYRAGALRDGGRGCRHCAIDRALGGSLRALRPAGVLVHGRALRLRLAARLEAKRRLSSPSTGMSSSACSR